MSNKIRRIQRKMEAAAEKSPFSFPPPMVDTIARQVSTLLHGQGIPNDGDATLVQEIGLDGRTLALKLEMAGVPQPVWARVQKGTLPGAEKPIPTAKVLDVNTGAECPWTLTFGFDVVLRGLREGRKARRMSWHPAAFIFLVPGPTFKAKDGRPEAVYGSLPPEADVRYADHIDAMQPGGMVAPWTIESGDVLGQDWVIL